MKRNEFLQTLIDTNASFIGGAEVVDDNVIKCYFDIFSYVFGCGGFSGIYV